MTLTRGTAERAAKRFVAVCIPGRDDADPGTWFVFDTRSRRSAECHDRHTAAEAARLANLTGELS